MNRNLSVGLFAVGVVSGCSEAEESPLPREDVVNIAAGDAVGRHATGGYRLATVIESCEGTCSFGGDRGLCEVGQRQTFFADVAQEDGTLRIFGDETMYVRELEGGIYADGSFEVGGVGTLLADSIEVIGLLSGEVDEDEVVAAFELWGHGELAGEALDCFAIFSVTGVRYTD